MAYGAPTLGSSFIGEEIGPQLAKMLAHKLDEAGVHPEQIFKQTGWFKDLDNLWKYEVGDIGTGLKPEAATKLSRLGSSRPLTQPEMNYPDPRRFEGTIEADQPGRSSSDPRPPMTMDVGDPYAPKPYGISDLPALGDVYDHPELFGYIPELMKAKTQVETTPKFSGLGTSFEGGWGPPTGKPGVAEHGVVYGKGSNSTPNGTGLSELETVLLHEIGGHGASYYSGGPIGGSPRSMDAAVGQNIVDQSRRMQQSIFDDLKRWKEEQWASGSREPSGNLTAQWYSENPMLAALYDRYGRIQRENAQMQAAGRTEDQANQFTAYEGSVGETAARNVETRAHMLGGIPMKGDPMLSGKQRPADVHPFRTMDYPPDLQYLQWDQNDPAGKITPAPSLYNWLFRGGQ